MTSTLILPEESHFEDLWTTWEFDAKRQKNFFGQLGETTLFEIKFKLELFMMKIDEMNANTLKQLLAFKTSLPSKKWDWLKVWAKVKKQYKHQHPAMIHHSSSKSTTSRRKQKKQESFNTMQRKYYQSDNIYTLLFDDWLLSLLFTVCLFVFKAMWI